MKQNLLRRLKLMSMVSILLGLTAMAGSFRAANDETLIDFPTSEEGIFVKGNTEITTSENFKVIKFSSGYTGGNAGNNAALAVSGGFKAGDVITVAGFIKNSSSEKYGTVALFSATNATGSEGIINIKTFNRFANLANNETITEQSFTLASDYDMLFLGRNGNTATNVTIVKVVRPGTGGGGDEPSGDEPGTTYPITAKWDFQNLNPASLADVHIEGNVEQDVASSVDGVVMHVIANGGKFAYSSSGYAQFNPNTKIQVPVLTTSDVVTVVSYTGQYHYTVGGVEANGNTFSHTATADEVAQGYVEIIGIGSSAYIYSIQVVQNEPAGGDEPAGVAGSVTWTVGNEATPTISSEVSEAFMATDFTVGSNLTASSATYFNTNMIAYTPATSNAGAVEGVVVEYRVKTYPGIKFTPTSVSYNAVKDGTDNATYKWSYTVDGTESTITEVSKDYIIRNNNTTGTPAMLHTHDITASQCEEFTFRIYVSGFANNKKLGIGNVIISGTVSGSVKKFTTVYDLAAAMMSAASNFEGTSGTLAPTTAEEGSNAPDMGVDATSGKLGKNNADWAQINAGTVLTLAGVPKGAEVTFALYNSTALSIDGVPYTNGQTYTATKDENLSMSCTTAGYIKSITVVGMPFVTPPASDGYTNTWYFGKSNSAPEFALQGSAEYTYTVNDHSMVINTDAGKLNNASRSDEWAQCNNGTLFKVPVYKGSKLTWGRYTGGSEAGFTIENTLYNDYYIATKDGTVEMTATGISYLSYIKIEPATLYDISGTITGGDVNGATIILKAAGNGQPYSATIAEGAFAMTVPADIYTPSLGGGVAYVVTSPTSITVNADNSGNIGAITIAAATAQTVTGGIVNAPAEAFILTFTATNDNSHNKTVNCEAGATSYSAELMPDTYTISSDKGTLSTLSKESFTVGTEAVSHNIYYPEAAVPAATQAEITVDNTATVAANIYNKVGDALAAAKAGGISAPVITLTSGQIYREQVKVDQANVTFKTSGEAKATITWYYGIGYAYYSLGSDGYYDKDRAMTRNSIKMIDPSRWGATVLITKNGKGFKAENIIFENSFNQYYTEEEMTDGVTPNGVQSITVDRQAQTVAADSKTATERAAAIAFENNPTGCQLYNCTFVGSQDTFYSSGTLYVKNCNIIGNTDYIFGGGYVVFDDCDLTIGGYSDQQSTAHITAYKDGSTLDASKKYVFRDCTVKKGDRQYFAADLGRDWGGAAASVYFLNLKNEIGNKLSYKWTNMNGGVSAGTADLHVYDFDPTVNANYNTTGANGANVNGVLSDADATALYTGVVTSLAFTPEHVYDIPLNDGSYYNVIRIKASNDGEGDVTLTRTIAKDKWATIVLPFAMTAEQVTETFGADVKVAELTSGTEDKLNFTTVTAMEANQPYAIKVGTDFSTATISGVTIVEAEPTQTVGGWQFVGTYAAGNIPQDSYFFSGNQLWQAADETNTIKPFRAWFTYADGDAARSLTFGVDETTDIASYGLNNKDEIINNKAVYDLSGRRVEKPTKGVYVVNGKKVVIK
jgi:pectin methylesterase-like acyl-CoA thioesterase